jgi:hypothetical protein
MNVASVNNRTTVSSTIVLFFRSPQRFFSLLSEKPPSVKVPLIIICCIALLIDISAVLRSPAVPIVLRSEKMEQHFFLAYVVFLFIIMYGFVSLSLIIESLWVKLCLKLLGAKTKFRAIFSFFSYTAVPILVSLLVDIFVLKGSPGIYTKGHMKIPYSKTSLAQFFMNYANSHPFLFYALTRLDPFKIWTLILGMFAVSALGKISYRKSFVIVFLFEIASSIPYVLISH